MPLGLVGLPALPVLIAYVSIGVLTVNLVHRPEDIGEALGRVSIHSLALFAGTLLFAALSVVGAYKAFRGSFGQHRWIALHTRAVCLACLLVTAYLAGFGMIGVRSWII